MAPTTSHGRALALLLLSVLLAAGGGWVATPRASADEATKVLLLLDVSGSMNERISSGGTKFAAAKKALKQVAGALPAGTQVGLRVYGSRIAEPKAQNPKACTDTQLVLPIGPLNRTTMDRAVDSFTAKGETPIAYSLGKAVDDLGDSGKRVLILISDGEETCSGDPCPTARKLAKSGVDLQFNAIGLDVNSKARKQLQCIADAGDGNYYDAGNAPALQEAIRKLTQRALRPFEVSGTPVKGTRAPADAPSIGVGQYRDRYDATNKPRYYTVQRTPGSIVTASIATVVKPFRNVSADLWSMELTTTDGQVCARTQTGSLTLGVASVYGGAVRSSYAPTPVAPPPPGCLSDPQLRWSLARQSPLGASNSVPVELLVSEQPPVTNLATLPAGLSAYDGKGKAVSRQKPAKTVVGGSSYSNAPAIGPGSFADTLAVGETVVYRVPLDYGQRLRVTATAPSGSEDGSLGESDSVTTHVTLYSPARLAMTSAYQNASAAKAARVTVASPEVRVRNGETPLPGAENASNDSSTASTSGDYFVGVKLDPVQNNLTGRVMSIRLDVAVDHSPSGQPQYASATPSVTPSPTPSATPTDAATTPDPSATAAPTGTADPGRTSPVSRGFVLGLLGGVALVVLAGIGLGVARRRRRVVR